jgi:hypothetical protein
LEATLGAFDLGALDLGALVIGAPVLGVAGLDSAGARAAVLDAGGLDAAGLDAAGLPAGGRGVNPPGDVGFGEAVRKGDAGALPADLGCGWESDDLGDFEDFF